MDYSVSSLMQNDGFLCPSCGKKHFGKLRDCLIGDGAIAEIPSLLRKYGAEHPFVLCDRETYAAAGERVVETLSKAGIAYTLHIVQRTHPAPDERIVGEAFMFCTADCDSVVAVGGGVLNDTGKIVAAAKGVPDIIVGTVPSMDGFASATSSMEREGLKVSIQSKCPDAVIAEPEILAAAPVRMIQSGIGDMLAKYTSLVEWKIAQILVDDYYCDTVADMVRSALDTCVKAGPAAVKGDKNAAAKVCEGLVVSGLAMNYAGISRPASGMEHYISHILDMRSLAFGTPADFHGIQCGVATLVTIRAYEELMRKTPDRAKALAYVVDFDAEAWNNHLRERLGKGAEAIIDGEAKERKYDSTKHAARLERILTHWDELKALAATLPKADDLERYMKSIGHPTTGTELGISDEDMHEAFLMAKDIRDKYVLGRLLWDLGEL